IMLQSCSRCDLGPSDVIFVAHLTHFLSTDHVDDVKRFMRDAVSTYDVGAKSVRIGVLVYDNSGDPLYALPLEKAMTRSQAESEILRISPASCGFAFCKVDPSKTLINAVLTAQSILNRDSSPGRMKKIIVVQTGRTEPGEEEYVQALQNADPWLRVAQVHIGSPEDNLSPEQSDYMQAYYQPYERYLGRLRQMYPNMSIPEMQYQRREVAPSKSVYNGVIRLNGFDALCLIRNEICELTFACPPCNALISSASSSSIDPRPLMKPAETTSLEKPADPFDSLPWPASLTSPRPSTTTTTKSPFDDAYEYEISGDPPGLTVNHTPVPIKDSADDIKSPSESSAVDFEDLVDDIPVRPNSSTDGVTKRKKKRRSRRGSGMSQAQCTCAVEPENPSPCSSASYQPPQPRYVPYLCGRTANPSPRCAQLLQPPPCGRPCGASPCGRAARPPPCGAAAPACGGAPVPCGGPRPPPCGVPPMPWPRPPAPEAAKIEEELFPPTLAPPASAYPQLPLPNAVELSSGIESTDISDWATKFSSQIEENAAKKVTFDEEDSEYEDFISDSVDKESKTKREGKKKQLTDFDKEYDYEAISSPASPSKKAQDEGWKKLLVDKKKRPRRIDNDKPDALLDALSILRPTPPSIDRLLNAFGSLERAADHEKTFKKETVAPRTLRTTTSLPVKKTRERSLESQRVVLTVDDVSAPRTTPPTTAEMLRRLQKLEQVLEAEAVIEAAKDSSESLAMLEGAARSRRTLKPSTLQQPSVSQKDVEREKVVKELHRLGKAENVNALFQEDPKPQKRPSRSSCHFSGVDVVLLLDDLSGVKNIEGLHRLVESIHGETQRIEECRERSRLAVLSLSSPGTVKMISPLGALPCPHLITASGCPLNETRCDQALSEGLILGVNLLTQEVNDRRKAIVVLSARNPSGSQKIASSLSDALQLAASLGVDVQPVEIGGTDLRALSTLTASGVAPLQWQDDPSGQLGLRNALCSQLSVSEEELSQKQAFCPWRDDQSRD
ncbi:hypothetical protein PENTCL1PPCAC_25834, partial [Pristionchus entomophagus]